MMRHCSFSSHSCTTVAYGWGPITRRSFPREAFPRDDAQGYVSARESQRAEKIGGLSDPNRMSSGDIAFSCD